MFVPNKIQENPRLWETKLTPQRTAAEAVGCRARVESPELCAELSVQEYLGLQPRLSFLLQALMTVVTHEYLLLGDSVSRCSFLPVPSRGTHGCLTQKPTNPALSISAGDCSFFFPVWSSLL